MTRGKADQVAMLIEPRHCVLCEIDEAQYQHCSLDGADPTGHDFVSGCERFRSKGYIEGPVGAPPVHEIWYFLHFCCFDIGRGGWCRADLSRRSHLLEPLWCSVYCKSWQCVIGRGA